MYFSPRLLTAAVPLALIGALAMAPAPARADSTPECNSADDPGPDKVPGTADDIQTGNTECGAFSYVTGKNGTAIGNGATIFGDKNTAIGENASVSGENSVALGQNSDADDDNIVSVGSVFLRRRITNVANGTSFSDAVNVAQMNEGDFIAQRDARAYTDTREALVRGDIAAGDAATLVEANGYTDTRDAAIRTDMIAADAAILADANAYTDTREMSIRTDMADGDKRIEGLANGARTAADTAIVRVDALGASTATALGGGAAFNGSTGSISAPSYAIGGQSYHDVGAALTAVDGQLSRLDTRIDALAGSSDRRFRHANGGIATAMALAGTMIVPDSRISVNFNLATYRGEQGFSGAVVLQASPRVYVSGGFAGSTVKGSTGGRVGVAFGF